MAGANGEIKNADYAEWLEKAIRKLIDMNANRIAMIAFNADGDRMMTMYECSMADLYVMSGSLQAEACRMELDGDDEECEEEENADAEN